jgi:hypothetical protein
MTVFAVAGKIQILVERQNLGPPYVAKFGLETRTQAWICSRQSVLAVCSFGDFTVRASPFRSVEQPRGINAFGG